jgi:hypothetical protein
MKKPEIQQIGEGRAAPGAITITFISPAGVMAIPVDDGALTCRSFLIGSVLHLEGEDGLLAELTAKREPIPWRNSDQRDDAIKHLREDRFDVEESRRTDLVTWIKNTGWFE